ncbi:hypothetical protein BD779DRAFT_722125 [Infundibulicybe gibba]|nr:hypothetical protein BD779DRAFT_722125 [Infundibulicybe gibba]
MSDAKLDFGFFFDCALPNCPSIHRRIIRFLSLLLSWCHGQITLSPISANFGIVSRMLQYWLLRLVLGRCPFSILPSVITLNRLDLPIVSRRLVASCSALTSPPEPSLTAGLFEPMIYCATTPRATGGFRFPKGDYIFRSNFDMREVSYGLLTILTAALRCRLLDWFVSISTP